MPEPQTTDPVVRLAEIREREEAVHMPWAPHRCCELSQADVPRLLAAVDALLKPHQPGTVTVQGGLCRRHEAHRHFSITDTEADDVRACPKCTAAVFVSCTGCGSHMGPWSECRVRSAISAALTGGAS